MSTWPNQDYSTLNLFDSACDHLPNQERKLIDGWIVCHKCGKQLRLIDLKKPVRMTR